MPFLNCQIGGSNMAFPDTCLTPSPAGPVPIPYPNMSTPATGIPFSPKVFIALGPAHNITTSPPVSNGDEAGVATGVASGMIMGPTRHMLCSTALIMSGAPATRMLDLTGHNGMSPNGVGASLVPSQVKVLCLR